MIRDSLDEINVRIMLLINTIQENKIDKESIIEELNLKDDDEEEKIEEKTSDNLESKINESTEDNT